MSTEVRPSDISIEVSYQNYQTQQTKGAGIMQILVGVIHLACGIVMALNVAFYAAIYFWGALTYIVTGILSITTQRKNPCVMKCSVGMNFLSVLTAGSIVSLMAVDFAVGLGFNVCYNGSNYSNCLSIKNRVHAIRGVVMILSGFELVTSLIMVATECKATCFAGPVVHGVSVAPTQTAHSAVVSPFQPHCSQQDVFYITNPTMNLNNLPTDDPPSYSECVAQTQ